MNAPTDLWLVRHGASEHHKTEQLQWPEVPLSAGGRAQAGRLAARLSALQEVAALYSSPLPRAWDTARPIAAALGLEPIPHAGLREVDFGQAGGLTLPQWQERWPELVPAWADRDNLDFRWPGGESRREFHRRIVATMEELVQAHVGQRIIVVAHTGSIGCYLAHLLAGNAARWREFAVQPASITEIEVGAGETRLLRFDDVAHLEAAD